jgi:hypothetical protein
MTAAIGLAGWLSAATYEARVAAHAASTAQRLAWIAESGQGTVDEMTDRHARDLCADLIDSVTRGDIADARRFVDSERRCLHAEIVEGKQ